MKEINSSYPNAEVVIYGKSYEGRDLMAVKFYRNSCNPTIFVEAGIHAREWITLAVTLKIIKNIAKNSSQDEEMSKLLDLYNWVFVPLVNPDGYDFTHHKYRFWRKSRRIVTKNCTGVDLNRNFDIKWGTADASDDPCSEVYCGTAPFSEPETQSLKTLIQDSGPLISYISLHSYAQLIICPYSYTKKKPEDYAELVKLAENVTSAIYNATRAQYTVGEGARALYAASGCSTDWAKKELGVKYSYAIEMRPTDKDSRGFILPASEIEPTFRDIFIALKTFANGFERNLSYLRNGYKNCTDTKQA
ncbi:carboxypeptidase B [Octopus sinensis]|uniref:Carboxypeptidase B n=1 Tax=Octopus sinensis TaxID=2607531 RepID=A0A6P7TPE1_9MOLL|nr:carboxypeptidase B [Octopus sinensis]